MTEVIKDLESDMASTAEVLKAQTAEVVATMTAEISEQQAKIVVLEKAVANNGPAPRELLALEKRKDLVQFDGATALEERAFFQAAMWSYSYYGIHNMAKQRWKIQSVSDRWDIGEDEEEERRRPDIAKRSPAAVRRASISPRAYAINTKQLIQVVASPQVRKTGSRKWNKIRKKRVVALICVWS
ncbi:hypothetical protein K1719_043646 [Acacia pycnantha]|nr:hypothetical protein K1719_043646 [Acacia pycnantha]